MPRENSIVDQILKYLNSLENCVAEKTQGTALSSGKADINGCLNGKALRIEVKTLDHGNIPSKKQYVNLMRWAAAGAICIVAYTVADVQKIIRPSGEIRTVYRQDYGNGMIAERIIERKCNNDKHN